MILFISAILHFSPCDFAIERKKLRGYINGKSKRAFMSLVAQYNICLMTLVRICNMEITALSGGVSIISDAFSRLFCVAGFLFRCLGPISPNDDF